MDSPLSWRMRCCPKNCFRSCCLYRYLLSLRHLLLLRLRLLRPLPRLPVFWRPLPQLLLQPAVRRLLRLLPLLLSSALQSPLLSGFCIVQLCGVGTEFLISCCVQLLNGFLLIAALLLQFYDRCLLFLHLCFFFFYLVYRVFILLHKIAVEIGNFLYVFCPADQL